MAADVKPHKKLLDYLLDKDAPVFVADLPRDLQDVRVLNAAWVEGLTEFGRRNYCTISDPVHEGSSAAGKKVAILEEGFSWTGPRQNKHKPLKDLLKEDEALPSECRTHHKEKLERPTDSATFQIVRQKASVSDLRLVVRITDKGYAALAA